MYILNQNGNLVKLSFNYIKHIDDKTIFFKILRVSHRYLDDKYLMVGTDQTLMEDTAPHPTFTIPYTVLSCALVPVEYAHLTFFVINFDGATYICTNSLYWFSPSYGTNLINQWDIIDNNIIGFKISETTWDDNENYFLHVITDNNDDPNYYYIIYNDHIKNLNCLCVNSMTTFKIKLVDFPNPIPIYSCVSREKNIYYSGKNKIKKYLYCLTDDGIQKLKYQINDINKKISFNEFKKPIYADTNIKQIYMETIYYNENLYNRAEYIFFIKNNGAIGFINTSYIKLIYHINTYNIKIIDMTHDKLRGFISFLSDEGDIYTKKLKNITELINFFGCDKCEGKIETCNVCYDTYNIDCIYKKYHVGVGSSFSKLETNKFRIKSSNS